MSKASFNCFTCGDVGHIAAECTRAGDVGTRNPPWCGFCDERTRTIDQGDIVAKCQECHPNRRRNLPQHRKCPHCHVTVYEWDHGECGSHSGPATPDRRPEREHIDAIVGAKGP